MISWRARLPCWTFDRVGVSCRPECPGELRGITMRGIARILCTLTLVVLCLSGWAQQRQNPPDPALQAKAKELLDLLGRTPRLAREAVPFPMQPPASGFAVGIVSGVAAD